MSALPYLQAVPAHGTDASQSPTFFGTAEALDAALPVVGLAA